MSGVSESTAGLPDRFELRRSLGEGAFGEVVEAFDRQRQSVVALKRLRRFEPNALLQFKREFRSLTNVVHPNLVTLFELFGEGKDWFFTMELVPGDDFLTWVRGGEAAPLPASISSDETALGPTLGDADMTSGAAVTEVGSHSTRAPREQAPAPPAEASRLRHALKQLAAGVQALHEAGQIHRDLKPGNVQVTEEGRVVILDFGLVTALRPTWDAQDSAGTPAYMAPEQSGFETLTEAADWYAVGVMLYQALAGRLPFRGSPVQALAEKLRAEPTSPGELVSSTPADLDRLCVDLMRRDPAKRPPGGEILQRLGVTKGSSAPGKRAAAESRGSSSASGARRARAAASHAGGGAFVGRDRELATLRQAYGSVRPGRPAVVRVRGPSGIGKSALLRRFFHELAVVEPSLVVLSGRCYQQESVPYKGVDSAMDELAGFLRGFRETGRGQLRPADMAALAEMFPVLARLDVVTQGGARPVEARDPVERRRRALRGLSSLLAWVAARRPLVLWLDDLQWGDVDSGVLLGELLRPPNAPGMLLVATYRSDEGARSPCVRRLDEAIAAAAAGLPRTARDALGHSVLLEPLAPEQLAALARELLGSDVDDEVRQQQAERIGRESAGSPYLATELVQHLQEQGDAPAESEARGALLDEVIAARLEGLPEAARNLLDVTCVAGHPLDISAAQACASLESETSTSLATLRAGLWLRTGGAPGAELLEAYHDRVREVVVRQLEPSTRTALHLRLAETLVARDEVGGEHIAEHLLAAGLGERAAEYAVRAAERAALALAFERAARYYGIALEAGVLSAEERHRLTLERARALANAGIGAEAGRLFLAAAASADDDDALELRRSAAEQFLRSGHLEEGLKVIKDVLRAAGLRFPRTRRGAYLGVAWQWTRLRVRGLKFVERSEADLPTRERRRIDACWSAWGGLTSVQTMHAAYFGALGARLALDAGEPRRIAITLLAQADAEAFLDPDSKRARRMSDIGEQIVARSDEPYLKGIAEMARGSGALYRDDFAECIACCERALSIFQTQCRGAGWEIAIAQLYSAYAMSWLGRWAELVERLPGWTARAAQLDDRFSEATLSLATAGVRWLSADDPDRADLALDHGLARWRTHETHIQHMLELFGRSQTGIYRGAARRTLPYVDGRWPAIDRAGLLDGRVHLWPALLSRAGCRIAAAVESGDGGTATGNRERRKLLASASRDVDALSRLGGRAAPAVALLLEGCLEATRGDQEEAAKRWLRAEAAMLDSDMSLLAAVARRHRGQLLGGEDGGALVADADAFFAEQKVVAPERLAYTLAPWKSPGAVSQES